MNTEEKQGSKKEHPASSLKGLQEKIATQETVEEKLKITIAFMQEALEQSGSPAFKDFWEAKTLALTLFKDKVNPFVRAQLWAEYTRLSSEVKKLKEILEEESSFTIEQIELALEALDQDITQHEKLLGELAIKEFSYDQKQREIQFYATLMSRVKELRKEILSTDMRVRHKNRLLEKLSSIGDRFIPKNRAMLQEVSSRFVEDVKGFVEKSFSLEAMNVKQGVVAFYPLKEEIKRLQSLAKKIALHSQAFATTRVLLSQCWEILQACEKEKKETSKQHLEEANQVLDGFAQAFKDKPATHKEEVYHRAKETLSSLDKLGLVHNDMKFLKQKLRQLELEALQPLEEEARKQAIQQEEKEAAKRDKFHQFKQEVQEALASWDSVSLKQLQELYESFKARSHGCKISIREEFQLKELHNELHEAILLKKEKEIAQEDSESLKMLAEEWEMFKEGARARLESYRKAMGSSGFDFEKAILYREYIDIEKSRLDRAIDKVSELEDRLE
ncbi:MAG: hypothetical protein FJZ63_03535 [Chlamydiae bacterium]|nr:hypothetical protein [Chlamydiota bacterium]